MDITDVSRHGAGRHSQHEELVSGRGRAVIIDVAVRCCCRL